MRSNILCQPMLQIVTHPPLILDFFDAWKWVKVRSWEKCIYSHFYLLQTITGLDDQQLFLTTYIIFSHLIFTPLYECKLNWNILGMLGRICLDFKCGKGLICKSKHSIVFVQALEARFLKIVQTSNKKYVVHDKEKGKKIATRIAWYRKVKSWFEFADQTC